jgi:hypothetical protein
MDVNNMDQGGFNPAEAANGNDMGTTPAGAETNPLLADGASGQAEDPAQSQSFKFAGKEYADRASAEKAWQKMYGKYSESQGIVNTIKKVALNNPELLESLSQDPAWAEILGKLGIERTLEEAQNDSRISQQDRSRGGEVDQQKMLHEIRVQADVNNLNMEEWRLERRLGRELSLDEKRAVYSLIKQHDTLSMEQAYKLANHERLLKEARTTMQNQPQRPQQNRPAPPPTRMPGSQVETRKPINKMSPGEWKENLRSSPEFRELLSRGGGS